MGCGFWLFSIDKVVTEYRIEYKLSDTKENPKVVRTVDITEDLKGPVYLFLELDGFYQNHRTMARSLSRRQLEDKEDTKIESRCQHAFNITDDFKGVDLRKKSTQIKIDPKYPANPCGFLAKNFPQDVIVSLQLSGSAKSPILVTQRKGQMLMSGDHKFKAAKDQDKNPQWLEVTSPKFENWMKTSSTSKFMNLWGVIEDTIPKGKYEIVLKNTYDETNFGGKKNIVISNSNAIGGKNPSTYKAFFAVGLLLFFTGGLLLFRSCKREELRFLKQTAPDSERDRGISQVSMF